jgi:hypothetical protein
LLPRSNINYTTSETSPNFTTTPAGLYTYCGEKEKEK